MGLERIFVLIDWGLIERAIDDQIQVPVQSDQFCSNAKTGVTEYIVQHQSGRHELEHPPDTDKHAAFAQFDKIVKEVKKDAAFAQLDKIVDEFKNVPPIQPLDPSGVESNAKCPEEDFAS